MRNVTTNVQKRKLKEFSINNFQGWRNFKTFTLILACFFTSFFTHSVLAQGCLSCETSSEEDPVLIEVSNICEVFLDVADLESDTSTCTQERLLTVANLQGEVLYEGINNVQIDSAGLINEVLIGTIRSADDASVCETYFKLVDVGAPDIVCENLRLFCGADTCVTATGYPIITDNCGEVDIENISYQDVIVGEGCIGNFSLVFNREWVVKDKSGNIASCTQVIRVERPDVKDVDFPQDLKLDCAAGDASPENTGYPLLMDQRIDQGIFCNITVGYIDDTTAVCAPIGYHIKRNWVIKDQCTNLTISHVQNIKIVDDVKPVINSPKDIVLPTDRSRCFATVNIPVPEVFDNCDNNPVIIVETSYGQNGFGPHSFVPKGLHMIHYTAIDRCGNQAKFSARLEIVDREEPTAIADEYTTVAIPSSGFAKVPANTFDSGSYDNCRSEIYFKARKMDTGSCEGANGDDDPFDPRYQEWFDDELFFCCEEVGQEIRILMRVYDVDPGAGPVDPDREGPGGDLEGHFTDAMIIVEVQDNVPPRMTRLKDYTVDCEYDYSDLSQFGSPLVSDYCGYTLDSTVVYDLNDCGLGKIERIFIATDRYDNRVEMVQTIYVENQTPFTEAQINWPPNHKTENCLGNISPENLPAPFNQPTFEEVGCADLSVTYEDQIYESKGEECYKVIRKWTVRDLCVHDPKDPNSGGIFQHLQVIRVVDETAPELIVPNDTIVALTEDCESVEVILPPATVNDCYSQTTITANSPYAYGPGPNISGVYPLGTTEVEFTAIDKCGNVTKQSMTITVVDQTAPQIRCRVGVEVALDNSGGSQGGNLTAEELDFNSFDNCSAPDQLSYFIRRATGTPSGTPPSTTELTFSCDDLGRQAVELWVSDQNNNSGFCVTFIQVTDPGNNCPNNTSGSSSGSDSQPGAGMIAGTVLTEEGNMVENVMIKVKSELPMEVMTGSDGVFTFDGIPFGKNYVVIPEKNEEIMNGVSTLDLVFMAKHITGTQKLNSPYKWVAADIDGSGSVSTLDLIKLRKLILHLDEELPGGQTSWRFIDANFEFSEKESPLNQQYPTKFDIYNFDKEIVHADFIAVKVGDVNVSAQANSLMMLEPRSSANDLKLHIDNQKVNAGEIVEVTFNASSQTDLMGYQFTLDFEPEKMELLEVLGGDLPQMTIENFGLKYVEDGLITTSWNTLDGIQLEENAELFTLQFRAKEELELKAVLGLTSRLTAAEAYNRSGEVYNVSINFTTNGEVNDPAAGFQLYQNQPNPFADQTTIGFELPGDDEAILTVYDASGKELYRYGAFFQAGYHELELNRADLPASGLLYYTLHTKAFTATKKMVLLK